ncbi:ATP-binding protein [Gemmata sp. JC673]|uniref:histidine kinase n=1 Tax=Gemmata algarum TaxID=2975278 RepID=A0ABU5EWY7_9BACT|nr:ATP-binding protein [Gemmata algarum]MDY3558343.1 ATP-binding protein [Gemmata algarum]
MARRRLRHKLMLGLVLVAVSIGLLACGAAYGLYNYYISYKVTQRKIQVFQAVAKLVDVLNKVDRSKDSKRYERNLIQVVEAQNQLNAVKQQNEDARKAGLDPDNADMENGLVSQLEGELAALMSAVDSDLRPTASLNGGDNPDQLIPVHNKCVQIAEALRQAQVDDIKQSCDESKAAVFRAICLTGFAMGWALALVGTMLYYFRVWMFAPIRELQGGVQRVHNGIFNQPIVLDSGDELQELADEFNAMVARLHAVYADLARQVTERSRQLVRSERMVSVGFLAAGVAHEINNPLASILFCSEALERRLQETLTALSANTAVAPPADAEVLARYLKMIQQEALRCKDITQKLLDFSRTGDRKKEPADLTGLVSGVLEVARHLPSSRGKLVAFEPTGYIVAPINAQDLKSVILNLVVNALDSMDDGGRLDITLGTVAGYAELAFTDTGCGMAPDVLENIFEPFYTKSRTGKGTGLGLFISHQIVDQHGGTITASSPGPGAGSTFTVRIPLQVAPEVADAPAGDPETDPAPAVLTFPGGRNAA